MPFKFYQGEWKISNAKTSGGTAVKVALKNQKKV